MLLKKKLVHFDLELVKFFANEDAFALAACFRLHDKKHGRVVLCVFFRNYAALQIFLSLFVLFVVVLLDFMLFLGVEPRIRKKVVVTPEFLPEATQMNAQSVFTVNVVHA